MPKAEQTRTFIIERTAPVFNMKGYAGTSLSDLEKATGLTKGSIYNNFANKDEVALACFDYNLNMVHTLIQSEMAKADSAREKLVAYIRVYNDPSFRHAFPQGGCPILNTAIEADDTHPALRERAHAAVMDWKDTIVSVIEQGIRAGEVKASVNAQEVAVAIVAMIEGGVMMARVTGKPALLKTVMRSVERTIEDILSE
ncbi:TetR/AcrR family transcriptional regulator [Dawidia soli]|uniref:TetR/AcrR family transcriptional regulator n=1 Tax=Dawidia soli TaxID=2782352 RepID=A0AAP2DDN8_9BACT|nr:TetR/AcrR family transcriptional regulator [Dawidia soli]MBT1688825.1 TetR/AcrR family transcriptional regulator [Dawidia soli]